MRYARLILSPVIAAILVAGFAVQAHANQLDTLLLPDTDSSEATFIGLRFIEMRYPEASPVASLLNGKNERVEFTASSGLGDVIDAANNVIQKEHKSTLTIENATLHYVATIKGYPDRAQISYKVEFSPTITKYVLQNEADGQLAVVDLDWRNFVLRGPLHVGYNEGRININQPIGLLETKLPDLAGKLLDSEARAIMEDPILNFSAFDLPMKSWHFLFDVTGLQLKNYNVFKEGEGGTVSIHSIGESSFREGTYLPVEKDVTVTIEGTTIKIHASTPPPSGQIMIAGYSQVQEKEGTEFALVSSKSSGGPSLLGFQFQVLLVLAGMMGAVAVFVLFKSRR